MLTAEHTLEAGRSRAIRVQGARIVGVLDLEGCTLVRSLLLRGCHIEQPVNLDDATAPAIRLPGCHLPGLTAEQLRTARSLELNDGFTAKGPVNLLGAHIGGRLDLSDACLSNRAGRALNADWTVEKGMACRDGFTADGEVRLVGAHIGDLLAHLAPGRYSGGSE